MSLAGKFLIKELQSVWLGGEDITAASAGTIAAIKVLIRDADSNIVLAQGADIPADTTAGYAKGCLFIDTDGLTGTSGMYENIGTSTSCAFDSLSISGIAELVLPEGNIILGNSSAVGSALDGSTDKQILIGNGTTITSVALSGDITISNTGAVTIANNAITTAKINADAVDGTKIADDAINSEHIVDGSIDLAHIAADAIDNSLLADNAVSLEQLDSGITPSHIVVYAGEITWSGSGASLATTVTGALASDIVIATIQTVPSEAAYLVSCAVTENTITTTLSAANTTNDAVISYQVLRAVS